ncbi:hypothetical protein ETAA8_45240 [Anatilimnocola aggregata]|uniref:Uncharacterized protein n=1 Tax=Anatilimnocola aggregata TaxID=2528021 RepID=A0A517YGQ1_9BACT|nr:hypothetical protein ETAA8_45240 [Anatilimnocola aggregata]
MFKLKSLLALIALLCLPTFTVRSRAADRPNVIVILADDK